MGRNGSEDNLVRAQHISFGDGRFRSTALFDIDHESENGNDDDSGTIIDLDADESFSDTTVRGSYYGLPE